MGSLCPKYKMCDLPIYRGVMCHDNEEWYQNYKELTCYFKDMRNSQILTRALESLKTLCFNWLLVTKVYLVWATKIQGSYLSWHWREMQFWRKTHLWFEKRFEKFGRFFPEHLKVSKLGLWWDPFIQSRKGMTLKFAEELCVMTMKNNAEIEKCWLVISKLRNLTILTRALENLKQLLFNWLLWPKYIMFQVRKAKLQNLKEKWLALSKTTRRIWQICIGSLDLIYK